MTSADTNLFLYAANPDSPHQGRARSFFDSVAGDANFVICELVLVEVYMQLRNPKVMRKPLGSAEAAKFCRSLKAHPVWQHIDYSREVSDAVWAWAANTDSGFRQMIDARLAFTLLHHGVVDFATANLKDFGAFAFRKLWNPVQRADR
jgi:toxin-antitoxin system PIN domain toxin